MGSIMNSYFCISVSCRGPLPRIGLFPCKGSIILSTRSASDSIPERPCIGMFPRIGSIILSCLSASEKMFFVLSLKRGLLSLMVSIIESCYSWLRGLSFLWVFENGQFSVMGSIKESFISLSTLIELPFSKKGLFLLIGSI